MPTPCGIYQHCMPEVVKMHICLLQLLSLKNIRIIVLEEPTFFTNICFVRMIIPDDVISKSDFVSPTSVRKKG